MTLYEINKSVEDVLNRMLIEQAESGEVSPETANLFSELQIARDEKIENTACYIKNLLSDIKAIKDEENNLKARRVSLEAKVDSLEGYLSDMLNYKKWDKSSKVAVSFRESKQTIIDDQSLIPSEFITTTTEDKIDLNGIKKAILDGAVIPGAHIQVNQNIQIK